MTTTASGPGSRPDDLVVESLTADAGPLAFLPFITRRQLRLEERLARGVLGQNLVAINDLGMTGLSTGRVEVVWRAAGLRRPGVVAQLSWPRLSTRLALGIETPMAHAIVDRLLGFERLDVEGRLQVTPVEWGVLTFVLARALAQLAADEGTLGPWDLVLDRVGPDPFDGQGLGNLVTLRWEARLGGVAASVRLWLPESLVHAWLASTPVPRDEPAAEPRGRLGALSGVWTAEAGTIDMPRGLGKLRAGGVLPLSGSTLRGTPRSPSGPVVLAASCCGRRIVLPAEPPRPTREAARSP